MRRCPTCGDEVRSRDARWCGSCGDALDAAVPTRPAVRPRPATVGGRPLLAVVSLLSVVLALAVAGVLADRPPAPTVPPAAPVPTEDVTRLDADTLDGLVRGGPAFPPPVREPTCGDGGVEDGDLSCFRWVASGLGRSAEVVAGGGRVVVEDVSGGSLTARDLRDGSVEWEVEDDRLEGGGLTISTDLVLHRVGGELAARELETGVERWRSPELWDVRLRQVDLVDDVLVVTGVTRASERGDSSSFGDIALGLEAATGAILWREEGWSASLGDGGVTVVAVVDGSVRAIEPTGDLRWSEEGAFDRARGGDAGAFGHVVFVLPRSPAAEVWSLRDGRPLGVVARGIASDDRHTLLASIGLGSELVLVDEDGEVWRAGGQLTGCDEPAQLRTTTVVLTTCAGGTVTLDRRDGSELARTRPPNTRVDSPEEGFHAGWFGPLQLRDTDPRGGRGDLVVVDTRSDEVVAHLPPGTSVVTSDEHGRPASLDGVLVLWSDDVLTALRVPR